MHAYIDHASINPYSTYSQQFKLASWMNSILKFSTKFVKIMCKAMVAVCCIVI